MLFVCIWSYPPERRNEIQARFKGDGWPASERGQNDRPLAFPLAVARVSVLPKPMIRLRSPNGAKDGPT